MRRLGESVLLGLSAATLFLAPVAEQLLRLGPAKLYFIRILPDRVDYGVLAGLILMIGLAAGLTHWASYSASPVFRKVLEAPLVLLLVFGIGHIANLHLSRYPPLWNTVAREAIRLRISAVDCWFFIGIFLGSGFVASLVQWPRAWMFAKPILCGGAGVVWLACGLQLVHPTGLFPAVRSGEGHGREARQNGSGNPVVWVILDEWDYDLTYGSEETKVYPEFDLLRSQSVFLEHVQAAGKVTLLAIPGLLMGHTLSQYQVTDDSGARFVAASAEGFFPDTKTIFDSAAEFGYQSHIVGWYHPYCRIFGAQADTCYWDDFMPTMLRPGQSAILRAGAFLRDTIELETVPWGGTTNSGKRQMARVNPMIERATEAAAHGGRSFSFLHLPVPHAPYFKLDEKGRMIPLGTAGEGYRYGLEAADRAIGSLRVAMERSGAWEEALVVVSSDHPYRYQMEGGYGNGHIPMMIKFPHQKMALTYSHPFQAVETKSLIEDFMQGKVATPERAIAWLDHNPPATENGTHKSVSAASWVGRDQ